MMRGMVSAEAPSGSSRAGSMVALFLVAVGGGAVVGLATASFVWLFESLTELVWTDLPAALDVDPYGSWFLFAIPLVGGVLVGLGQLLLGNYPRPIEENVTTWKQGGQIEPSTVPATATNSLVALVAGAPIGFEAALTGLIGGLASLIARSVGAAGRTVRRAWGAERLEANSAYLRSGPYWLAAVAGLFTYRWLPFGQIDMSFRFADQDGHIAPSDGLVTLAFAMVLTVPLAWAAAAVGRAEVATVFRRSPVVAGVLGGLAIAALASVHEFVLFSGQGEIQSLDQLGTGTLWYVAVAKWAGLVIVLFAGWRGGPIFPLFTAVAAIAVAVDRWLTIDANLMMIAGIAAVSVVLLEGNVPLAVVLTLYAVPLSFVGEILIGATGAVLALGLAHPFGLLPTPADADRAGEPDDRIAPSE